MTGWRFSPTPQRPACAVLHRVLADLAQRQIIQWRQQPGANRTPLGPLLHCGGVGSADVLVVLAPYGYVLALTGMDRSGTLSNPQRALLDTLSAAGVVALVVYTRAWFDLVDEAITDHAPQRASAAADAVLASAYEELVHVTRGTL